MNKQRLEYPLMKVGLLLILINFSPNLFSSLNSIPYFGIIRKICLIFEICFMLNVMFKEKIKRHRNS